MAAALAFIVAFLAVLTLAPAFVPLGAWRPGELGWLIDAQESLNESVGWITGFNGTVVVALYLDRAWGGSAPRPQNRAEARHRLFVATVAILTASAQTYVLAAIVGAGLLRHNLDPTTFVVVTPATAVVVTLCLSMSARARPTLVSERKNLDDEREVLIVTSARLDELRGARAGIPAALLGFVYPTVIACLFASYRLARFEALQLTILIAYFATGWTLVMAAARVMILRSPGSRAAITIGAGFYTVAAGIVLFATMLELGATVASTCVATVTAIVAPFFFQVVLFRHTALTSLASVTRSIARALLRRAMRKNSEARFAVRAEQRRNVARDSH